MPRVPNPVAYAAPLTQTENACGLRSMNFGWHQIRSSIHAMLTRPPSCRGVAAGMVWSAPWPNCSRWSPGCLTRLLEVGGGLERHGRHAQGRHEYPDARKYLYAA